MNDQKFSKYKTAFVVAAALIALLEIPGARDVRNQPYSGFWTDPTDTVIKVFPDSPAQQAGFLRDDHIISSGGIDLKDSKALAQRPRAKIGEARTYVVERGGQNLNLDLTFAGLPAREVVLSFAGAIVGFCFLIFGLYAYWRVQNQSTTLLALVGMCFGLAFVNMPYLSSYALRTVFGSITITLVVLGFAFLLHFMMGLPKAKAFLSKKNVMFWLYGPAVLVALLFLFLIIYRPEATSALNTAVNIIVGLFVVVYLGLAVITMVYSYAKSTSQERAANGLHFVLVGTVVGLAPYIIAAIVGVLAPKLVLPGVEFYTLSMVLIPIALALATLKKEHALASAQA